ncbi:MAG TPA: SDR family NAD(P)-dependent oxidoreductase [Gammaproteobacteria bacterium]
MQTRIAIVTGANRGLGLEVSRQLAQHSYHVILTGRRLLKVQAAVKMLHAQGLPNTEPALLDVSEEAQVRTLLRTVMVRHGHIDVLINNAAQAFTSTFMEVQSVTAVRPAEVLKAFDINALGAFRLCRAVMPLMNEAGYGRIVNVSSTLGQLSTMEQGWPAYQISKTALNAVTRLFAAEAVGDVKVNSVCPGWSRTEMGGPEAERSVAEGAASILWAALLPKGGPNGGFFRDGEPLAW